MTPMADLSIPFRLPIPGWPRATFESDYGYRGGRLVVDQRPVLEAATRDQLLAGRRGAVPGSDLGIWMRLAVDESGARELHVGVDGAEALREDRLSAPTSRSAWIHAWIALAASACGFIASYLYVLRAAASGDPWPLKMAYHMASWHGLLTLTLFPASVWGQRVGIRTVQVVSFVFFAIHVGIALANLGRGGTIDPGGPGIATLNAASGLLFLVATIYGNRAYSDMDPVRALIARAREWRVTPGAKLR